MTTRTHAPALPPETESALRSAAQDLQGELDWGSLLRTLYATDASAYREMPLAVAFPRTEADIVRLIRLAHELQTGLIPRTAGTSLAGQVVGSGIVVDVSRYWTRILEINPQERWVRVQPGVIRDELNRELAGHGMMFGPETSTSNRAMLGGMLGNNSCGSNSVVYGSTRDHVLEIVGLLSDGSRARFHRLTAAEVQARCASGDESLEARIYRQTVEALKPPEVRQRLAAAFPKPEIHRRNTGYALDLLAQARLFDPASSDDFDFCRLLAGSEGTLCFTTEIKLNCIPLPPPHAGLQCAHFENVDQALRATQIALQYRPYAVELMDHFIIEGARRNRLQAANASFVQGNPGAILMTELRGETVEQVQQAAAELRQQLVAAGLGYHYPVLVDQETDRAWQVRKAGLGVVANIPGDAKPVAVIEDTAVAVVDLPDFIAQFNDILKNEFGLECVHYAHAGSGEIHLRPILNLKTAEGNEKFRRIAQRIADLVKAFQGSLSGEHGDGRLRGEFLEQMIGPENYQLVRRIKQIWDPAGIFNPGKIVDTPPMNSSLRYWPGQSTEPFPTVMDFSHEQGLQRAAELCSGSGDCRKTVRAGGTMCPSYMATGREEDSTRGRANMLREAMTFPIDAAHPLDHPDLKAVMDRCLSCKGCQRECPSNVDVAKLKAEYLQAHHDRHGVPRRARQIAGYARAMGWAAWAPGLYNALVGQRQIGNWIKRRLGFATQRELPRLHSQTLRRWFARHRPHPHAGTRGQVWLFADEFTNFQDQPIGVAAVELLERLGYEVLLPPHQESGRAAISKGLLRQARTCAEANVRLLAPLVSAATPLVGIEPSAILSFRDEYPLLVDPALREAARGLAEQALMFDEFIEQRLDTGEIDSASFESREQIIRLHGHCHQKALASLKPTIRMLQLPQGYRVRLIPSGCCGMAGSFGFEAEHYELSMQIGELVLFPTVAAEPGSSLIAAPGTSCRHQILEGTGVTALHPIQILRNAWSDG